MEYDFSVKDIVFEIKKIEMQIKQLKKKLKIMNMSSIQIDDDFLENIKNYDLVLEKMKDDNGYINSAQIRSVFKKDAPKVAALCGYKNEVVWIPEKRKNIRVYKK